MNRTVVTTLLVVLGLQLSAMAETSIWIEGEDPASHNFNSQSWYNSDVDHGLLSPTDPAGMGNWLWHYEVGGLPVEATYRFPITEASDYTIWIRSSSFEVSQWIEFAGMTINGEERAYLNFEEVLREEINLTHPTFDLRFLGWVPVGPVTLEPGEHRLTIGLESNSFWEDGTVHGGIDAICITDTNWLPTGDFQPGDLVEEPLPDEWFVYAPTIPDESDESILDISDRLHRPAGIHGALQVDGHELEFADGTPVRVWGVNATMPETEALMEAQAEFLVSYGVNLVRIHPLQDYLGLLTPDLVTGERILDRTKLDEMDRWFAVLKEAGIYVAISPFWPHLITEYDGYDENLFSELPSVDEGRSTAGFVNFSSVLQEAEWTWVEAFLTHENPYTGTRYVDDPALAIMEIHNEDSIFWHFPLNDLASGSYSNHLMMLQEMWTEWLNERYLDDEALFTAWGEVGNGRLSEDSLSNYQMDIYGSWEMEATGPASNPNEARRMADFIEFLAETQRDYYQSRESQLRGIGFSGVTITTAWQAGGAAATLANLWTDSAMDVIDRHAYSGGGDGGHYINEGSLDNQSYLSQPGTGIMAAGFEQLENRPFLLSEWTQSGPNQWKAEAAPLYAFYGIGLQGWDGSMHFGLGDSAWMETGWPDRSSYASATPHYMGQFPALGIAIHDGHFQMGEPAAARRFSREEIFLGVDPTQIEWLTSGWPDDPGVTLDVPPEVFAIGRVTYSIDEGIDTSERLDWDSYWDDVGGVVYSSTGELTWHYRDRYFTAQSPKTQGVVGFAGGRSYALPAIDIDVQTEFVSLLVTALDDRPLMESGHILITALAQEMQSGALYNEDGTTLNEVGAPPLMMEPVQASFIFYGEELVSVRAVDFNGVPTDVSVEREGNQFSIDGRYGTFYYEVITTAGPVVEPVLDEGDGDAGSDMGGDFSSSDMTTAEDLSVNDVGEDIQQGPDESSSSDQGTSATTGSSDDEVDGCGCSAVSGRTEALWFIVIALCWAVQLRRRRQEIS